MRATIYKFGGVYTRPTINENAAYTIARDLWRMRLAGWFDQANAVLVGGTNAPDEPGFTQLDPVRSAHGELDVPVVIEVDCGHLPPHLALVNGALTDLTVAGDQDHHPTLALTARQSAGDDRESILTGSSRCLSAGCPPQQQWRRRWRTTGSVGSGAA